MTPERRPQRSAAPPDRRIGTRAAWAIAAALALAPPAVAEPLGSYVYLVPYAGFALFPEHVRFSVPGAVQDNLQVGGRLGFQSRDWIGIEVAGGFTPTSEELVSGGVTREHDVDFFHGSVDLKLTPFPRGPVDVFVLLGAGGIQLHRTATRARLRQWIGEGGAGVQLWMGDAVALRAEARQLLIRSKSPLATGKEWLGTTMLGGGLTFAIGATPRDTDGDGVPDRQDQCAGTPRGARVDARGCPADGDGDQVADGIDQCPDTPRGATVDARGCPTDGDGDGVADGIDQCADTPRGGSVDTRGCPTDADGDGVWDGIDACAGTPSGATVDARGCPTDADGDGVWDGIDRCPGTSPGLRVDAAGCPIEVSEIETQLLDTGMIRLEDVNFETGKATLMAEALPSLDAVGAVLSQWPELRIEIGGHTDSRGSAAYNQRLSEARVRAVLDHLLARFPDLRRDQYTVVGYGESRPLAPNTSALNMARNRRVEFRVLNRDVLRREIQHRKLLRRE